jgi:hypothetical protein
MNLYFGFRDGEMYWLPRGWGHPDAWLPYDGHEMAFAYLGFLSTGLIIFGLAIIIRRSFGKEEE